MDLPAAFFLSSATLNGAVSTPTLMSLYSFATEMHWPLRLSRAKMYIGVGWLFCVTLPDEIRYGIGVRICAPSMPLPSEPSTRLSRVAPRGLLHHLDAGHAVFGKEALLLGDEQRRRVGERDEAEIGLRDL